MWVFSPVSRKKNRKMHTFWRCLSYWKCAISISLPEGKRVWQKMRNCIFLFVPRLWPILLYPMQPWHGVWLDLPHRDEVNQSRPKIPSRANMQLFWVSVLIEPNGSNWPSPWKSSDCVKPLGKCFFPIPPLWACLGMPVCQALFQVPGLPAVTSASQSKTSTCFNTVHGYHQHAAWITSHISVKLNINTKNDGLKVSIE